MTRYYVYTDEYEEWVTSAMPEPSEWHRDVVEVEANTKREAKIKGLRELRRTGSKFYRDHAEGNPFQYLSVESLDEVTFA